MRKDCAIAQVRGAALGRHLVLVMRVPLHFSICRLDLSSAQRGTDARVLGVELSISEAF